MPEDRKVEILEQTSPQTGYYRIDRFRLRHSLHQGGMSPEISREVFERGLGPAVLGPCAFRAACGETVAAVNGH